MSIPERTNDLEETFMHGREIGQMIRFAIPAGNVTLLIETLQNFMVEVPDNDSQRLVRMFDQGIIDGLSSNSTRYGDIYK